ncbi:unnamed protein product [Lactuca virosa]|uniref:Uncharacterized protein n=1 Tax=Lactuca virosa TaxID=75947 RepID=A0AAU9N5M8_9ASTR|nr:unnamed protein product [Lactuca virosa]
MTGATDRADTPAMLTASDEEPIEDIDEIDAGDTIGLDPSKPDYTPTEHASPVPSEPDYTLAEHGHISSDYESDEDEEDTTSSPEISPPLPTDGLCA